MPTPTNIDVAAKAYSKKLLVGAQQELVRISDFSIDFSEEAKQPGESVLVQLSTAAAAGTWNSSTNNFRSTDATSIGEREVTLNQRKIAKTQITPTQMANFHPYWWQRQGGLNARSVALAITAEAAGIITPANYGDAKEDKINVSLDGFSPTQVASIREKSIVDKSLQPADSVLVLNPAYFSQLLGKLDSNVYGGREAIVRGTIPGLLGFASIVEWPGLTLPGFVASRAALAFAGRKIPFIGTKQYEIVKDEVVPEIGAVLTTVVYVDGPSGEGTISVNALFGVAAGADDQLIRLVAKAA
ncbi:MAG: hypothetical protein EOM10_11195 [Opitutae bacterium]|nr:hypothetical protein [Opitutae bacterium]